MTITNAVFGVLYLGVGVGLAAAAVYVLATEHIPIRLAFGLESSPRAFGIVLIIDSLAAILSSISTQVQRPLDGSLRIGGLLLLFTGMVVGATVAYLRPDR